MGIIILFACNEEGKKFAPEKDNKIALRDDSINVVKLTDTLVIYESTCRGCQYEGSTRFEINDSLELIKLQNVITANNNPGDMAGGSIGKELLLVPLKTGTTKLKLYKFWSEKTTREDSAKFKLYTIEVRN